MIKKAAFSFLFVVFLISILFQFNCSSDKESKSMTNKEMVAKGKYLVDFGGCNYCHSPKVFTNLAPVPDNARLLSGHPANEKIDSLGTIVINSKWIYSNMSGTAWGRTLGCFFCC